MTEKQLNLAIQAFLLSNQRAGGELSPAAWAIQELLAEEYDGEIFCDVDCGFDVTDTLMRRTYRVQISAFIPRAKHFKFPASQDDYDGLFTANDVRCIVVVNGHVSLPDEVPPVIRPQIAVAFRKMIWNSMKEFQQQVDKAPAGARMAYSELPLNGRGDVH